MTSSRKRRGQGIPARDAAQQSGLLTDPEREALRHEQAPGERHIVLDRLLSPNGMISALLVVQSVWALRHPRALRRAWRAAQAWSKR